MSCTTFHTRPALNAAKCGLVPPVGDGVIHLRDPGVVFQTPLNLPYATFGFRMGLLEYHTTRIQIQAVPNYPICDVPFQGYGTVYSGQLSWPVHLSDH